MGVQSALERRVHAVENHEVPQMEVLRQFPRDEFPASPSARAHRRQGGTDPTSEGRRALAWASTVARRRRVEKGTSGRKDGSSTDGVEGAEEAGVARGKEEREACSPTGSAVAVSGGRDPFAIVCAAGGEGRRKADRTAGGLRDLGASCF